MFSCEDEEEKEFPELLAIKKIIVSSGKNYFSKMKSHISFMIQS